MDVVLVRVLLLGVYWNASKRSSLGVDKEVDDEQVDILLLTLDATLVIAGCLLNRCCHTKQMTVTVIRK